MASKHEATTTSGISRVSDTWLTGSQAGTSQSLVLGRKYSLRLTIASLIAALAWLLFAPTVSWMLMPVAKMATGILLVLWMAALWMLFLARVGRDPSEVKLWHRIHRGAAATICIPLMFHAQSLGYGTNAALTIVFFVTMIVGLFSRETLTVRSRKFWTAWMVVKVGLAVTLLALIGLHVYVGVRFHS